jgi:choline dehydrogenase-like flavoprotein
LRSERVLSNSNKSASEYDYVIAGAGSAGCLLALRLSEDPTVRVCLIEAGGSDASPLIRIPVGFIWLFDHRKFNWRYTSEPLSHLNERRIFVPRGKVLGGTSAINGMVYMRGHPSDYDEWAEENPGWSFREIMPYFLRLENNHEITNSPYHGNSGPLHIVTPRRTSGISEMFLDGVAALGHDRATDFNGAHQQGFGYRQLTQLNGRRETASTAFLSVARGRKNLSILTGLMVDKVVTENGRAVGVRCVSKQRQSIEILVKREVVLAAGVFGSPAILQRSGIGDPEILKKAGIELVTELRGVGRNLQDHPTITVQYRADRAPSYGLSLRNLPALTWSIFEYLLFRKGLLASNILEAGGFLRSEPDMERSDLQFSLTAARKGGKGHIGLGHGYSLTAIILRPESKGTVFVRDADPFSDPAIDLNILADERDVEATARGLKFARKLLNTEKLKTLDAVEELPGHDIRTDEEITDFVKQNAATGFHPVGTCKMGVGDDAVVDHELRVYGVQGLRVADAAIMPKLIGGNTNVPTYMIADKAADLLLGKPAPTPWPYADRRTRL